MESNVSKEDSLKILANFKVEVVDMISKPNPTYNNNLNPISTPIASPSFGFTAPVARRSNISPTFGNSNRRASYLNKTSTVLDKQSPNLASSYTQSITPLNPDTCSVRLGSLSCLAVYSWIQDMQHLELTHPHEHLSWGRFMKKETAYVVKSHAEYNKLLNRTIIIDSNYIMLDNSELIGIILDMIKPQSSTQYIIDLRSLVKPVQLPNGYIITNDWSWCYRQIILLAQRFKDALEMLNSTVHSFQPGLKSRSGGGKPGLIELFYYCAPKGKEIHNDLNDSQVRSCETMQDYFDLFLGKSQNMYDNSKKSLEDAAILRGLPPLTPSGEINKESSYKHHNNNSNNNSNSNNNNNNITPNNNTKRY